MFVKFARQLYHSLRICSSKLNFYKVEINTDLLKIKKKKKKKIGVRVWRKEKKSIPLS